jgi:long-chain acyl-CoA synthetase
VGEIMIASPTNTRGTFEAQGDERLFWNGRFIRTGDLGYLDDAGNLFIVGRTKNTIKHGGMTIFPQEVEALIEQMPAVRRAAATGIDRGDLVGEQLYVFVELRKAGALSRTEH